MPLVSGVAPAAMRLFPASPAPAAASLTLHAALNERVSFQLGMRSDDRGPVTVRIAVEAPDGWTARTRRIGLVPVRHLNTSQSPKAEDVDGIGHIPGYVPDPLFDENEILLPTQETHAFRITLDPPADAAPGKAEIVVTVLPENGRPQKRRCRIVRRNVTLEPLKDFDITHWFYADALCDRYGVEPFSEAFWPICEAYMRNYADHGLSMIYVPVFTPPLDGVKRPTQLLHVTPGPDGTYVFDWSQVRRWVRLARACGIRAFEWTHPFTQWGVRHAIRIYAGHGADEQLLWPPDTGATSETYRTFLGRYLPELHEFLVEEGIAETSVFHVSDEPHNEDDKANYIKARALLRELAPWMNTMDALTDIAYGREQLTDMPVPSIRTALTFVEEGIPCWCYYCCGPRGRYLNRLMDTPLAKIAMHGMLFHRWPFKGFLHWGYNYWYRSQTREMIDPYSVQDGCKWPNWAYGDTFVVYPGPDGPIDSLRWETFSESLQDLRLLQTARVPRNHKLLAPLRSFEDFPKSVAWREKTRRALFSLAEKN